MKNIKFQIALLEANMCQRDLAKATGINEALISLGVRGGTSLMSSRKKKSRSI